MTDWPFGDLKRGHYGAIVADPPWSFDIWDKDTGSMRSASAHYSTASWEELESLPVSDLAAQDCALFIWVCWPSLPAALRIISAWGFQYKTCAFDWCKADNTQPNFFIEELPVQIGMGYWTRANSEPCLLGTRGKPKRLNADVRQAIVAPRREHSRKPDGIHERIERLVSGPYCELFAHQKRNGWSVWGNETEKFQAIA